MAALAVAFLLENLGKLLEVDQYVLISGGESHELILLKNDIQVIESFLDSVQNRGKGEELRRIERDVREAVYNAEDIVDAYCAQAAAAAAKTLVLISKINRVYLAINLSIRLRTFRKEQLMPLIDRVAKAKIHTSSTIAQHQTTQHHKDSQLPFLRRDKIVGFEDERKTLITYLLEESEDLDIISITGEPGLGKTTLARSIYKDPIIRKKFPVLIWISFPEDGDMKTVFLTILKNFTRKDMSGLSNSLLADILRNNLENNKFLLVVNDVHTTKDWSLIKVALPKSNRRGKILITTHNQQLAAQVNSKREPHLVRPFTYQESWELLQLRVFGNLHECPSDLEELGKQIVKKCDGLPLAVVKAGEILRKLSTSKVAEEWENVLSSLSTLITKDKETQLKRIITLSFHKLPDELKECFLYFGMFPQDAVIPVSSLVRLWIAEGFIRPRSWKSLEEAAEDNLKELVDRNLVVVVKTRAGGGIKSCRVSKMISEFCRSEATFERENLFQEVKGSSDGAFYPPITEIPKYRRLCIHSNVKDFIQQRPKGTIVRSFLSFSKETTSLQPESVSAITKAFGLLRVFHINSIKFDSFPTKIFSLIHLRYIVLSCDHSNGLPEAIVKLWNLQTIKILTTLRTFEIKANIWNLISLRHLKTKAAIVMNKEAKGNSGENLQTLSMLSPESLSEDICKRALNLRKLGIRGDLDTLLNTNSMARLDRLQKLKLLHDVPNEKDKNPMICLPSREAFPPNLRILELSSTFLEWKHMDTLGMLLTLEILKLKQNAFTGKLWKFESGLFPSLEVLLIKHTDLENWSPSEDSFPRLKCLVLKRCNNLREIPLVLAKSLQELVIGSLCASAVDSARSIKREKLRLQDQSRGKSGNFKLEILQ